MKKPDFSGYATKHDVECSDGRIIRHSAFTSDDQRKVPLMWAHMHQDPTNVIGHALLEHRDDGVYAYAYLNASERAEQARELVAHGDLDSFSIYANRLKHRGNDVVSGRIVEVSLVLAGANPGAVIDNVLRHSDDVSYEIVPDSGIITFGESLRHDAIPPKPKEESDDTEEDVEAPEEKAEAENEQTINDVFDSMTEEQKNLLFYIVEQVLKSQEPTNEEPTNEESTKEEPTNEEVTMSHNLFERQNESAPTLTAQQRRELFASSLQHAMNDKASSFMDVLAHASGEDYGIKNIEFLFPEPQNLSNTPDFISRDMEWVSEVINGTHKVPFSRIRSVHADITGEKARAKGYVKGAQKTEEVFKLLRRVTTPTTIYKKQKLDRDDVVDITDFDVVSWMSAEMGVMLREELARAILTGDGRKFSSPDKINEENIRPIYLDHELYAPRVLLNQSDGPAKWVDEIVRARAQYKGTGNPTLFTTSQNHTELTLLKDGDGRRLYATEAELCAALRVAKIVDVEVMEGVKRSTEDATYELIGIMVNMSDYTIGATKGGETHDFTDFDIDFNQLKFLKELRCCGALHRPKSALIIERKTGGQTPDLIDSGRVAPKVEGTD